MNKAEIHTMALLAAAKITLVAGATGCERERAGAIRREPVAPTVHLGQAAPGQTACETPHVATPAPTSPAPTSPPRAAVNAPQPPPSAAPPGAAPRSSGLTSSTEACTAAAAVVRQTGVPSPPVTACCNDLLARAQAGEGIASGAAFSCCFVPGVKESRSFCSPWGPPAPPAVPAWWLS